MSRPDVQRVKKALLDAGLEIYRSVEDEIHVAERVRLHIMDSGVRVKLGDAVHIAFTARSQRSDFPEAEVDTLFAKVRTNITAKALPRGYAEATARSVEVKDPLDDSKILDVWHEVTFEKAADDLDGLIEEVRWALEVEKYVTG